MPMAGTDAKPIAFNVDAERRVSGLFLLPKGARAIYVLAHGAGNGMTHPFLEAMAVALAERGIGTLRYQFPYMEKGGGRPDQPKVAQATVAAAVREARRLAPRLPIFAGGKSFGGRMTSQAAAEGSLPDVRGLVFLGFPLHAPGRPSNERAEHLANVAAPMLFVQGTRDEFADFTLLEPLIRKLGSRATLHRIEGGNHSFGVAAKIASPADVRANIADAIAGWMDRILE
jgi:predicted alpha/beta-hydrolase family hydrolase